MPRPRLSRLVVAAVAAFLFLAAVAPATITSQQGRTFDATAGQEFNGTVAEFHSDGKEPYKEQFSARIYWGDGTEKTDGVIEYKGEPGVTQDFLVQGKHTYAAGGSCKVSVEIKQPSTGQVVTVQSTANVSGPQGPPCGSGNTDPPKPPPDPPQAKIGLPPQKPRTDNVTIFGSQSVPGSSTLTNYHWDYGDGTSEDLPAGTGFTTVTDHIYKDPGTYTVSLTVTDANGLKSTTTEQVEVLGSPKAVISFTPDHGKKNTEFTFRGNKSSVPAGKIVRWEWTCHGKKTVHIDSDDKSKKGPKDQAKCVFGQEKLSTVQLDVTSSDGIKAHASTSVPVLPKFPPIAALSVSPEEPTVDQPVTFDASASKSDPKGDGKGITKYHWDWGDGTSDETTSPTIEHAFTDDTGPHEIFLTVTDAEGSTKTQDVIWVQSKCVSDTTVRGLQLRSDCLLETSCYEDKTKKCYSGLPGTPVKMNGVDIVPGGSDVIYANQATGQIHAGGYSTTQIKFGPLPLHNAYQWSATIPEGGGPKVVHDSWRVGGKIHGFSAQSDPVVFNPDGSSFVPVNIKLPSPLQNISGHVDIAATNDTPVYLGNLHIEATNIPLAPFHLNYVTFDYSEADNSWYGSLSLASPSGTFGGDVGFVGGEFNHLGLFGENLNLAIGQGVFLQRIAGSYTNKPRTIDADVGLSAGPQLCIPGVGCGALVEIGGHWNLTYPAEGGWSTSITGEASMIAVPMGAGFSATYQSIGRFDAVVHFNTTLYAVFDVNAHFNLAFFDPGYWQAAAGMDICTKYIVHECAGGDLMLSSIGIAACIRLPAWLPDVGGYYKWGAGSVEFYFSGCSVGDVQVVGARIRGAQEHDFRVEQGTRSEVLAFEGADGPPNVILTGPKGERVETPADGYEMAKPNFVSQEKADRTTYVILGDNPSPGTWKVSVAEGSTPVVNMKRAQGIPDPKVKARVTGSGLKRRLEWSATPIQGQRITFSEQGAKSGRIIGSTTKARGSLAFTPVDGPKGKRTIVAEIIQGGNPRAKLNVASYTAPRVAPGKPGKLRLRRKGTSLVATWGRAAGATGYDVQVTLSDGRLIPIVTDKRTVTIPGFARSESATVTVAGYRRAGLNGPAAKASLKPPKAKKKKKPRS